MLVRGAGLVAPDRSWLRRGRLLRGRKSSERGALAFADAAQVRPVDFGVPFGQGVDVARGEAGHVHSAGLGRTEANSPVGDGRDPSQSPHPFVVDPAHAEPGGGLLGAERRLTLKNLWEIRPGAGLPAR